ncbi:MAG: efflux RND transporter permease subunit, partial [Chloroflexota bacterium]|nr:efflux RND transporter permease subunit [Chloroflexota bacterium]
MHVLTRFSLKKISIVLMVMVLVVLGGFYSAGQLKSELLPNINLPNLSVVAIYPGAAPDDVRRDVAQPIEKIVAGTPNLKTMQSVSNDSVLFLSAQYEYGTDMEKTQRSLEESINRLTLPSQVQRPTVGRFNFQDIPVLAYTLNASSSAPDALAILRRDMEDKLVPELKAIPGVNSVVVAGGGTKQVLITLNDKKLRQESLTAAAITGLLQANNISFPTGQVVNNGQSIPVRVLNQISSLDDMRKLVVRAATTATPAGKPATGAATGSAASSGVGAVGGGGSPSTGSGFGAGASASGAGGGTPASSGAAAKGPSPALKLSDVASVDLVNAGGESISRSNGKPSLSLIIYKTQNANTVQVADDVSKRLNDLDTVIPGTHKEVLFDQSTFIKESLDGLIREGLLGAILAIVVILIFLRSVRSTLVTAVSIPLSVLIALIMLNLFG